MSWLSSELGVRGKPKAGIGVQSRVRPAALQSVLPDVPYGAGVGEQVTDSAAETGRRVHPECAP